MHNGVFKSLKEVVHFYNTRNARILDETLAPEVSDNIVGDISVDQEGILGNLGLTDAQEDAIVAFLKTLSDQGSVLPPQASSPGKK
jgi:cytochrome c peroxidase